MAKYKSMVTGLGRLGPYPYLTQPDFGFGEFKQARGKYKCTLDLDADDPKCVQMMEEIKELHDANYQEILGAFKKKGGRGKAPKQADLPYFENGDGTVTFKFNSWASYVSRTTNENIKLELPVRDKDGKPFPEAPRLYEGSEVRIKFNLVPYGNTTIDSGVKLQLQMVRVYSIAEFGGDDDWGDDADQFELSADNYKAPKKQVVEEPQEEYVEEDFDNVDF